MIGRRGCCGQCRQQSVADNAGQVAASYLNTVDINRSSVIANELKVQTFPTQSFAGSDRDVFSKPSGQVIIRIAGGTTWSAVRDCAFVTVAIAELGRATGPIAIVVIMILPRVVVAVIFRSDTIVPIAPILAVFDQHGEFV
jgi:hypothetical protein